MAAFTTDISVGEILVIGDVRIRLQFKTGRKSRLKIETPEGLNISIKKESMEAT